MPKSQYALTEKYLSTYAEPETSNLPATDLRFSYVLVIPAYRETLAQIEQVFSSLSDLLVILVANSPDATEAVSQQLLRDIDSNWSEISNAQNLRLYEIKTDQHVLVVDRVNQPIPPSQGVGLARKIGADIATQLIHTGQVRIPWIFSTDADAKLPDNYFSSFQNTDDAAQLFPFSHVFEDDLAAALYEYSLVWYPFGLKFAGSPFAFPTIGSTLCCHADAYVKARGFPVRAAGEDFYLLNKLRKLGDISYVPSDPIQLSARRSDRVPFGTGPGLTNIDSLAEPNEYELYHPEVFIELKKFLVLLETSFQAENLTSHFSDPLILEFVSEQTLLEQLHSRQQQSKSQYRKFLFDWFDGFRTLKFIHLQRDNRYPSVPFQKLWQSELLPETSPGLTAMLVRQSTQKLLTNLMS